MRVAQVVGNIVSTVKDPSHAGQKLMIVDFLDGAGRRTGENAVVFDAAQAGVGDVVLVSTDGGASAIFLRKHVIADMTICSILDSICLDGEIKSYF